MNIGDEIIVMSVESFSTKPGDIKTSQVKAKLLKIGMYSNTVLNLEDSIVHRVNPLACFKGDK